MHEDFCKWAALQHEGLFQGLFHKGDVLFGDLKKDPSFENHRSVEIQEGS